MTESGGIGASAFDRIAAACAAALRNTSAPAIDDASWLLAARHGVLPLLSGDQPHAHANQSRDIARRQLNHCNELRRIADVLHDHVDFIALKGPVLSHQLYGNVARRDSLDLDILVRPRDVPSALETLRTIGYTTQHLESGSFRHWLRHQHELSLMSRADDVLLELQWSWAQRHFAIDRDIDACFEESTELSLAGANLRVLSAEDTLLYLAVHGAKHGWSTLSLVTDFAAAGLRLTVDWNVVSKRAHQTGLGRLVEIGAALSNRLFGIALPIRSSSAALVRAATFERRLHAGDRQASMRLFVQSRERLRDRMRVRWRLATAPSPSDMLWVALPDRWFGAYYVLRPLRLLLKPFARHTSVADELPRDDVFRHFADAEAALLEQTSGRR
jgi:hypothetical protein